MSCLLPGETIMAGENGIKSFPHHCPVGINLAVTYLNLTSFQSPGSVSFSPCRRCEASRRNCSLTCKPKRTKQMRYCGKPLVA